MNGPSASCVYVIVDLVNVTVKVFLDLHTLMGNLNFVCFPSLVFIEVKVFWLKQLFDVLFEGGSFSELGRLGKFMVFCHELLNLGETDAF